ncbi:hypothetical protein U8607_08815 [Methylobacterium durans]|uniref:hypothetical protein n=1 Tax=Methylobacterium durans TaxID=2202825 RepID=UPI002AFFC963|nr:hypothetical protein [Methylobacterium durans]MEA1832182.1 hypothetical protein [Methylobacterium durans]
MTRLALLIALLIAPTIPRAAESGDPALPARTSALVQQLVDFAVTLEKCRLVKPGRNAQAAWHAIEAAYAGLPARWERDRPLLRSVIRAEINRQRLTMLEPADGWCTEAKRAYGARGLIFPDAISMIDGSASHSALRAEALFTADTLEIYQH